MKVILGPAPCKVCRALVTLRRPPKRRSLEGGSPPLTWLNADWTAHNCRPKQVEAGL